MRFGLTFLGCILFAACGSSARGHRTDGGTGGDGSTSHVDSGLHVDCTMDVNMDGIPDAYEATPVPGVTGDAVDDDGDGFSNIVEAVGNYPGYSVGMGMVDCSHGPLDCDVDGLFNLLDSDSDNDGVPDATERTSGTNPCAADTDGDGVDDIVELAAGSAATDPTSMPPAGSLYVTIPYHPPPEVGDHPMREFSFMTRIQIADVFILVDNSASMGPIINALRSSFSSTIVPGIRAAIPDVRIGVGSFDSVPDGLDGDAGSPGDYTLWVRQRVDADATLSQNAFNVMNTIDTDTGGYYGGDYPEDQPEALFESISGDGMSGHESDEAARRSVHNGLDPSGDGWVPRMDPTRDCLVGPDDPPPFGWACFGMGRVPILVLASDAAWYNGYVGGIFGGTDPSMHTSSDLTSAMLAHGAYFVGIDVGTGVGGDTYNESTQLAMMTGTIDGSGHPVVFGPGSGGLAGAASDIVNAITTLAGETPQDITTRTDPDPGETRLPPGRTTAQFITMVTPSRGVPDAPMGFTSMDATTFYAVKPSTTVYFNVDFYNDFQAPIATAQLFRATIQVLGRAGTIVDHRDVYMIVPATGGVILH